MAKASALRAQRRQLQLRLERLDRSLQNMRDNRRAPAIRKEIASVKARIAQLNTTLEKADE